MDFNDNRKNEMVLFLEENGFFSILRNKNQCFRKEIFYEDTYYNIEYFSKQDNNTSVNKLITITDILSYSNILFYLPKEESCINIIKTIINNIDYLPYLSKAFPEGQAFNYIRDNYFEYRGIVVDFSDNNICIYSKTDAGYIQKLSIVNGMLYRYI